jgi:hypothetical protein
VEEKSDIILLRMFIYGSTAHCWALAAFFLSFMILCAVGRTPWTG